MADFIQKSDVKTSVWNLTIPLADMAAFQALVTDILTHNPWGCVDYVTGGQTIAGVVRGTERYTGKVVYENNQAKTVGQINVSGQTNAGFRSNVAIIL